MIPTYIGMFFVIMSVSYSTFGLSATPPLDSFDTFTQGPRFEPDEDEDDEDRDQENGALPPIERDRPITDIEYLSLSQINHWLYLRHTHA